MPNLTLSSFDIWRSWPAAWGTSGTLAIGINTTILGDDGVSYPVTANMGGALRSVGLRWSSTITVTNGLATCGSISGLPTTDTALPSQVAGYNVYVYDASGKMQIVLASNYLLHSNMDSVFTWAQWVTANAFTQYQAPVQFIGDYNTVQSLIDSVLPVPDASDVLKGKSSLSVAAISASLPKAKGDNDPLVLDAKSYASLAAAVTAIGSTAARLNISTSMAITGDVTIPSTLALNLVKGGMITGAHTLTINGPFSAGPYQVFGSTLTVVLDIGAAPEVYTEWWGASTAATAATNTPAMQKGLTAAVAAKAWLTLLAGTYHTNARLTILAPPTVQIRGSGSRSTIIQNDGTDDALYIRPAGTDGDYTGLLLQDIGINGNALSGNGINIQYAHVVTLSRVNITNNGQHGMLANTAYSLLMDDSQFDNNGLSGSTYNGVYASGVDHWCKAHRCRFNFNSQDGFFVTGTSNGVSFLSSNAEWNGRAGVNIGGCAGVEISGGSYIEFNTFYEIWLSGVGGGVTITGNYFHGLGGSEISILVNAFNGVVINGNKSEGHAKFLEFSAGSQDIDVGVNDVTDVIYGAGINTNNIRFASVTQGTPYITGFTQGGGPDLTISGNAVVPTNEIHRVGAGLIKNITNPTGFVNGTLTLIAGGTAYTTDATGNIGKAITPAPGDAVTFYYLPLTDKWYPN